MKLKYTTQEINTLGLVTYYKLWGSEMTTDRVFDYSLGGYLGMLSGASLIAKYPGFNFDGSNDFIELTDVGSGPGDIKTILLWVKPASVSGTDYPIDLNGTDYLTIVDGTLTRNGFAGGTWVLYTDGLMATTVTANWHHIGITDTLKKDADDLTIGRETANYFQGLIGEVMLYTRLLEIDEIRTIYEIQRHRYQT